MKGLREILWVSWTANKTNEWVLNKARVKRELLDTVKAKKLAYYGHTMFEETRELPGERDNTRNNARCTQARKTTHSHGWTTSIHGQDYTWKSHSEWQRTEIIGESTFMVWPTLGWRTAKEQNRSYQMPCVAAPHGSKQRNVTHPVLNCERTLTRT